MLTSSLEAKLVRPIIILLAEDEPGDRELMEIALMRNNSNCKLEFAEDGIEALQFLRREHPFETAPRPDLVILDLNLPRKDGREVLREMKAEAQLKDIPVIVLSTSYEDTDVAGAYRLGANSYIVKPGNFHDFNTIIQRFRDYWLTSVTLPRRM